MILTPISYNVDKTGKKEHTNAKLPLTLAQLNRRLAPSRKIIYTHNELRLRFVRLLPLSSRGWRVV